MDKKVSERIKGEVLKCIEIVPLVAASIAGWEIGKFLLFLK